MAITHRHVTEKPHLHYGATMQLDMGKVASIFQSFTDITRLRILRLFLHSRSDLCLCDISAALSAPSYKISRHLKALRQAGLLEAERSGRWLYHRMAEDRKAWRNVLSIVEEMKDPEGLLELDQLRLKKTRYKRSQERCRGTHGGGHA